LRERAARRSSFATARVDSTTMTMLQILGGLVVVALGVFLVMQRKNAGSKQA
jgi:hypothetical protein